MKFLNERGVPDQCIILFGESLGSGVAVQLAKETSIAGLVLQSPYTTLAAVGQYRFPYLPVNLLLRDKYNSINKIKSIHIPILILYGVTDRVIPPKLSRELFLAANSPKEEKTILNEEGRHDTVANQILFETVLKFLKQFHCKPSSPDFHT